MQKRKRPVSNPTPSPQVQEPTVTVFSLRIPDGLKKSAQDCAQSTGVSINGLICTALADYLSSRGYEIHPGQKIEKRAKNG